MGYSVGEVAKLSGVTVRTLHHYDDIGLLAPSERSDAGYRGYDDADLARLQRILFYRELGLPLSEIAVVLDDPDVDELEHLRRQRDQLADRIARLEEMVAAITRTMEAKKMGISLNPEEMFEVFGDEDPTQHADEAEEHWGDTDAWRQSQRRTSSYTKDDWLVIKQEQADIERGLAETLTDGAPPTSERAMDLAERHRRSIDRWFYDLPHEAHRHLADMYVTDPRFRDRYDAIAPGLAEYVHDAVHANADRHDAGRSTP